MADQLPSQEIYRGKIVTLKLEDVPQPIGGTTRFEIVEHPDAVAIVAARYEPADGPTAEPRILLVRQQRPAIRRALWEIPAGLVRDEERANPEAAARRELLEETGLVAEHWERLAREYPSPGFSTESITIFLATNLHPVMPGAGTLPHDPTEIEQARWVPLSEAVKRWRDGGIEDGKTIIGLQLVYARIQPRTSIPGGASMLNPSGDWTLGAPAATEVSPEAEPGAPPRNGKLKLDNILIEEFRYASQTAYQALEDRARMFNLYLVVVGVVASGLGAVYQLQSQLGNKVPTYSQPLALLLVVAAGVMGIAFFFKLIRLRQAYHDSLLTMNYVKEYYIREFKKQIPDVGKAFRWRLLTVPSGERFGSLSFYVCTTVAMLGSFCFAAATIVLYEIWQHNTNDTTLHLPGGYLPYVMAAGVFIISMALHMGYFARTLSYRRDEAELEIAAQTFGLQEELKTQKGKRRKKA